MAERIRTLSLPRRFEILEREVAKLGCPLASIVQKVDSALSEIEIVLRETRSGKIGVLKIVHGNPGTGKTTFLKSLPQFFANISVTEIPSAVAITDIAAFIEQNNVGPHDNRVYIIYDRDNPTESDEDLRLCFERLRQLFRTEKGVVVVVWPITEPGVADRVADIAWAIGRDSLLGIRDRVYHFYGLPQEAYYKVADVTAMALNSGDGLEAFGLSRESVDPAVRESTAIGEFYARLNAKSSERNAHTYHVLKEKTWPHVWIVVPGDDLKELNGTIRTLTQGVRNEVDIARLCHFLDDKENESEYLSQWRKRRADMAYLMRTLDVRLFELPPNAALASIRSYGSDAAKTPLKKKSEKAEKCAEVISRTTVAQALVAPYGNYSSRIRDTSREMIEEYSAVQQLAARSDEVLNKAVGDALRAYLESIGNKAIVLSEKQSLSQSQLRPDIQVVLSPSESVCLELTWRTTGAGLPEREGRKAQNTLTPGHIQKYLLEKVMEYVSSLAL